MVEKTEDVQSGTSNFFQFNTGSPAKLRMIFRVKISVQRILLEDGFADEKSFMSFVVEKKYLKFPSNCHKFWHMPLCQVKFLWDYRPKFIY